MVEVKEQIIEGVLIPQMEINNENVIEVIFSQRNNNDKVRAGLVKLFTDKNFIYLSHTFKLKKSNCFIYPYKIGNIISKYNLETKHRLSFYLNSKGLNKNSKVSTLGYGEKFILNLEASLQSNKNLVLDLAGLDYNACLYLYNLTQNLKNEKLILLTEEYSNEIFTLSYSDLKFRI